MTGYFSLLVLLSGFYIGESESFTTFLQRWQPRIHQWCACDSPSGLVMWCHSNGCFTGSPTWVKPYATGKWRLTVFQCYCNQLAAGIFLETMDIKANGRWPSQRLNIDYLNIAEIGGCNWVQTALPHNYGQSGWSFFLQHRKGNSCLPVQHTAHRQIMQVGQFGSCIVIAWSGNDQAAFQSTHTFI